VLRVGEEERTTGDDQAGTWLVGMFVGAGDLNRLALGRTSGRCERRLAKCWRLPWRNSFGYLLVYILLSINTYRILYCALGREGRKCCC